MTLPSRGLGRWLTLRGVTERVTGAAILDQKSWGPPSWCRGGRHLGSEVVGAAILDRKSCGPPSWTGSRGGRHLGPEVTSLTLNRRLYYCLYMVNSCVYHNYNVPMQAYCRAVYHYFCSFLYKLLATWSSWNIRRRNNSPWKICWVRSLVCLHIKQIGNWQSYRVQIVS